MKKDNNDLLASIAIIVAVTFFLFVVAAVPLHRLDVPYAFSGDAVDKLTQIQTVAENGWLFHNHRLGYPFGYDRLDFPRFDSLNYAIMGPIAAITGMPGFAMNVYFLAGFYLIALAAYLCFRRLGCNTGPAIICALVYAFLPYHFVRGVHHLTNGAYFLVPPAMLAVIWLARDKYGTDTPQRLRAWILALIVAVLLPIQTPYNGVFFVVLCCVAGTMMMARKWTWQRVVVASSLILATGAAFVAEQIPSMIHTANTDKSTISRVPFEGELYALRLHQVVLPNKNHRIDAFGETKEDFDQKMRVPDGEIRDQYIGILGVLGLISLLWLLLRSASTSSAPGDPTSPNELETNARVASVLAIAVLIFALSSGIGTLISYFVTDKIRAYNRILPFLAFLCILGGGWLLQTLLQQITSRNLQRFLLIALGTILILDVIPQRVFPSYKKDIITYDQAHTYFGQVEKHLGNEATLFQLPAMFWPENGPINDMKSYDDLKPFLLSETLRFSAGSGRIRMGHRWGKFIERQPARIIIESTYTRGFSAVLIDSTGYDQADFLKLTEDLQALLPEPPLVSPDQRWWTFPLKGCCEGLSINPEPATLGIATDDQPLRFTSGSEGTLYFLDGWQGSEPWGTWATTDATLGLILKTPVTSPLTVSLETRMMLGPLIPVRTLTVSCNNEACGTFSYDGSTHAQVIDIRVPDGAINQDGRLNIRFVTTPEASPVAAGVNEDTRILSIGLTQLSLNKSN